MVSAAKLRRAQDAILQMRPYAQKLQEMLSNIVSGAASDMEMPLAEARPVERILFIPVTSDRGLCGAYNANVIKVTRTIINEKYAAQLAKGNVTILPIGKKGYEYFTRNSYNVVDTFWTLFANLSFESVREAAAYAQQAFLNKEYDRVEIVYSQFKNAATQAFVSEQYLPIPKVENTAGNTKQVDFIFVWYMCLDHTIM